MDNIRIEKQQDWSDLKPRLGYFGLQKEQKCKATCWAELKC